MLLDIIDTYRDIIVNCLTAESVIAYRRWKFLSKVGVSEKKLCSIFVANAVKKLSAVRQW